jgi:feruloyl esterase
MPDTFIASTKQVGAHVEVQGLIGGNIRFELLLPDSWNGRFVMGGGGGFVGSVQNGARDSVNHGYATVGTDTGHEATGITARWAYTNLEAQIDFGYLAVHRTAEVAKAFIRAYYRTNIAYSYFTGCSRGGGQAMMEAQRYPKDFDGIVAGAPAFDWTGIAANAVTIQQVLYPDPEHIDKTALDLDALKKLQQAIIDQCDALDGLKDGIVQDPPSAHFDLSKVSGLTDEQRKAITTIYAGAHDSHGLMIYPGYTPGAECDPQQWIAWIVGPAPQLASEHAPNLMFAFGTQIFKYLIFNDPEWNYAIYRLTNFAADTRVAASYLNATNPDLSGLKAHQGKLIIWHGWADPALPAQATVDYYRRVRALDSAAADYCRLFMVPGCLHCGGGPGASEVNWLSVIADWVEHGQAPGKLIASKHENGKIQLTRPLYSYPTTAIYPGTGDPASAASFVPKPASTKSN